VTAQVVMRVPTTNESFLYQQQATADEQGEFTVTLPYSTTGYDNWGPEQGYTNVSVRSESPYQFVTRSDGEIYSSRLTVPEGNVNGANETTLSVDLERVPLGGGGNESDSAGGDSSSGSESVALPAGTADATGESSATPATTPSATGSPMLARPSA
jgi:dolichyl-diphosphooligosaccharide--protein glycosyltransferase